MLYAQQGEHTVQDTKNYFVKQTSNRSFVHPKPAWFQTLLVTSEPEI
jgi:hypothetical protein